jgi:UDP-N-acetyl-2-amino-2-deoxyglucuronate dehydrogenase
MKPKIGFVGLGHNGIAHIEAHRRLGKSLVAAVCDKNPDLVSKTRKTFQVEHGFSSTEKMLEAVELDAVSIHTGDEYHVGPFLSAGACKKHLFVEKPVANSIEQLERMIEGYHSWGRDLKVAVGYILRFNPVYTKIYEHCRRGDLGRIYYLEGDYIHNLFYQREKRNPRTGANWYLEHEQPMVGGGSHPLDLLRWFTGREVLEVTSLGTHAAFPEMRAEDCQVSLFRFADGTIAKVAALFGPMREMPSYNNLRIYGTRGTVEKDTIALCQKSGEVHPEFRPVEADRIKGHPYDAEIDDWLDAIEKKREPVCSFLDGARSTLACLKAVEALKMQETRTAAVPPL